MIKIDDIIKCLNSNDDITDYEIISKNVDESQLFYVLKNLEISRFVNTNTTFIKIYISDKETTVSKEINVTSADDEISLKEKIAFAVKTAKFSKNKYYPLASKASNILNIDKNQYDLNDIALKVAKAIFEADKYQDGWINSTEIFVSKTKLKFNNSNGIEHEEDYFKIQLEVIPTWSNNKEEFELYKFFEEGIIDYKRITEEVNEILELSKLRSNAISLDKITLTDDIKVLVQDEMIIKILANLLSDVDYASVYMKENHYSINDLVSNNQFDLTLKPLLEGSSQKASFDSNGVVLKDLQVIKNGKLINNWGSLRYGYYLGVNEISGGIKSYELNATGEDFLKQKHLIIDLFSSPQLDPASGYWGGEVRLARYFDGEKYIPLTSFSISGLIYDDLKNIHFSKDQILYQNYKGPKYFIFDNLKIH